MFQVQWGDVSHRHALEVSAAAALKARRAERLWPTAKAVGWPVLVDDQARQPTGDRLPALRPIFLSPLRGLLMTLMLYPMAFAMGHILPPLRGSGSPQALG